MYTTQPNELYHHGRLGQHWGKRNGPPYPLSSGIVRKAYKKKGLLERHREKKEEKKSGQNTRHQEIDKDRLIREGSASEVLKYEKSLTTQEIKDVISRIETTNKLAKLAQSETESGWEAINQVMKKFGNVKDWTKTASEFYKAVDDISSTYQKRHH